MNDKKYKGILGATANPYSQSLTVSAKGNYISIEQGCAERTEEVCVSAAQYWTLIQSLSRAAISLGWGLEIDGRVILQDHDEVNGCTIPAHGCGCPSSAVSLGGQLSVCRGEPKPVRPVTGLACICGHSLMLHNGQGQCRECECLRY